MLVIFVMLSESFNFKSRAVMVAPTPNRHKEECIHMCNLMSNIYWMQRILYLRLLGIHTYCAPRSLHKLGLRLSASSTVGHKLQTTCVMSWQYVWKARVICCASCVASIKFIHFWTQHAISIAFTYITWISFDSIGFQIIEAPNPAMTIFLCISLFRASWPGWSIWSSNSKDHYGQQIPRNKGRELNFFQNSLKSVEIINMSIYIYIYSAYRDA